MTNNNQPETKLITRKELCDRLEISRYTAWRLSKAGVINGVQVGKSVRYNWEQVVSGFPKSKKEVTNGK